MQLVKKVLAILVGVAIPTLIVVLFCASPVVIRALDHRLTGALTIHSGQRIYPNSDDSVLTPALIWRAVWEPQETALALSLVEPGETVIDAGANVGYYTILLSPEVGPNGKIFAFEPEPTNFELLTKGVSANGLTNVVAEQLALSDSRGSLKLYLAPENKGDHRISPAAESREAIEVQALPLDDYLPIGHAVNFVKVDTQGAEALILAGMRRVLEDNQDIVLVIEFWPIGLHRAGGSAEKLLADLAELGFDKLFEVSEGRSRVTQTTARKLLTEYTVENEKHTNVVLPKGRMRARVARFGG